jgi:chemotaxis protein methyltransferase CheR
MKIERINDEIFEKISNLVNEMIGLNLSHKKKAMVNSRLSKRLRELGLNDFEEYYQFLDGNKNELIKLYNLLTTNVTKFFREEYHFSYLEEEVLPNIMANKDNKKIKVWSAGCSSGEEAYSLAIVLKEFFNTEKWDVKILATDINTEVLKVAREGIYHQRQVKPIPYNLLVKHFKLGQDEKKDLFKVKSDLKDLVRFGKINLNKAGEYPIKSKFDFIFCRIVFIYFIDKIRNEILYKFHTHL